MVDSGATSHTATMDENTTNLRYGETRATVGDNGTLTRAKCGYWHEYQKFDGKLHCLALADMAIMTGLHTSLFSMAQALKKGFQLTL